MSRKLKVLVGCEFSGVVREAFRALGHDAWSMDLLPCEDGSRFHIQDDVRVTLDHGWDLAIFHPPCTYLCNSGVRWLYGGKGKVRDVARWTKMLEAAAFFRALLNAPILRIAVENPVPHSYALEAIGERYAFTLQPFEHGEPETKRTAFWTRNLPPLKPSNIVSGRNPRVHHASPGPNRWKERSRTLPGIAKALAEQYGAL